MSKLFIGTGNGDEVREMTDEEHAQYLEDTANAPIITTDTASD